MAQHCDIRVLFVAQCTLVKKRDAVHSGSMQFILAKSDEFENSYSRLCYSYILLNS